ncbi:prepilin peptidase [Lichenifustis flavocetrariae]|uniref:Prepilin peptidase n=1 Tax=Lichenifustis flavocetrariae TaxID=2949735 RepID=A0AA41YX21_9HYPH|nr:prepilin peptidase [Lichenifustis flavocetrariae]MCW6508831.1 prepilin peptidase [Lichenifustis flavocetrariae]
MTALVGSPFRTRWRGGLAAVFVAGLIGLTGTPSAIAVALMVIVAWIVWRDVERFTIPDAASASLLTLAVTSRLASAETGLLGETVLSVAVDAALPGLCLWLFRELYFRRKGFDGIGLGDVKLAFAGGALVGLLGFADALFGASAAGLLFVGLKRGCEPVDRIAFGAVLAPALGLVWAWQQASSLLPYGPG